MVSIQENPPLVNPPSADRQVQGMPESDLRTLIALPNTPTTLRVAAEKRLQSLLRIPSPLGLTVIPALFCPNCTAQKCVQRWVIPSPDRFCTNCHHRFTVEEGEAS